ncbi:MAG TPA: hypothetical protein PKC28_00535 [Bdellovibrionales bacterium]|nr:hypothetical protein [Bdellovibrionales bacterium]
MKSHQCIKNPAVRKYPIAIKEFIEYRIKTLRRIPKIIGTFPLSFSDTVIAKNFHFFCEAIIKLWTAARRSCFDRPISSQRLVIGVFVIF